MKPFHLSILPAAVVLAACASGSPRMDDRTMRDRYTDYTSAPVSSVSNLGRFDGWRPLGRDKLILWTGFNDAYVLTVDASCQNLDSANRIGVTTSVGTSVQSGFDYVRYRDFSGRRERCRITEIRPLDYKRMKEDMKAAGQ